MLLLCLVAIGFISTCEAFLSCGWTGTPGVSIPGGEALQVGDVQSCEGVCVSRTNCTSIDYVQSNNTCYLHNTQSGKIPSPGITHYDHVCSDLNQCDFDPCDNGGTCVPLGPNYECTCPPGYTGDNCDDEVPDPCAAKPCQNAGTCGVSGSNYQCTCPTRYTGVNCESLVIRDVVPLAGSTNCLTTNYPGSITDLYTGSNGVTWNFQIATFGFDWQQAGILGIPINQLLYVDRITFSSSDNLNYFRVVFKKNNGQVITTNAIGPNDKTTVLSGVNDVKRVDFYLASSDFTRNVSLNNVTLKCCISGPLGLLQSCVLFDVLKVVSRLSFCRIQAGGVQGSFSVSTAPVYPFIELNLTCAGVGTVSFVQVSFGQASNFDTVVINVWDGSTAVTVRRNDGVATNTFSYSQGIYFASNINGNRIRSTIIPNAIPNQGISETIGFSKYSVFAIVG